jgi:WD40 repeat protein
MTATQTDRPSIAERVRAVAAGAPVVAAHMFGAAAVFVLGEESLLFVARDGAEQRIAVHTGAILCAAADKTRVVTGGDDGKLAVTNAQGETSVAATDEKRRWIDRVAAGPDGTVAWAAGKEAHVRTRKGDVRTLALPSSAGGLAFAPKGLRLAVAHYNGVTLWFPNAAQATPEMLAWKGSHLDVTFSPDGRFLVTAMQEPMLHGWRLADGNHMRMSGYTAKVRSMGWTADGKGLATGGSTQLIIWPFASKDGPMGKQPGVFAPLEHRVAVVACHPSQNVVAAGYEDGTVLLVRLDDAAEILARRPGDGAVSALAWNAAGSMLAFGTEEGEAGVLAI